MKTSRILGGIVAVIVIIIVGFMVYQRHPSVPEGWKTYTENDFGFEISYPSDWILQDNLTQGTCCLFVAHWVTSTSTVSTTTTTATEYIKLQVGYYDAAIQDPFKAGTTTQVVIGGTKFYRGVTPNGYYYLLPRSAKTGVGIAEFRYLETPAADVAIAEKIIGTLRLLRVPEPSQPVATSTAATGTTASGAAKATASSTKK